MKIMYINHGIIVGQSQNFLWKFLNRGNCVQSGLTNHVYEPCTQQSHLGDITHVLPCKTHLDSSSEPWKWKTRLTRPNQGRWHIFFPFGNQLGFLGNSQWVSVTTLPYFSVLHDSFKLSFQALIMVYLMSALCPVESVTANKGGW